ncbi:DNA-binding transcriptional MocR family regulator [Herbaspirillum sp. Sphag1AN]|uniref:aminotransferase-like domain-containing protein n=1 Tax=unclassified Herbaspirillum TaxID=2624150 RepID=UPI0016105DBE|nr:MULTISPECIES: PLP-dependent aminotransferase family protein [unclassified Herbaspirillum]MBB3214074.1 DNA-binding transcriptional MocR family regulator [Herbaspirillum sp. Sphag1AN]MBB3247533.1 DNA-binding transcriptional MocR family regulator [Herbaspirillum sp. Sphag64]
MPPLYHFNPSFQAPQGSPIREMFKYMAQPGMISFAGGYPAASLFDVNALAQASTEILAQTPSSCLQYGATEGMNGLAEALRAVMQQRAPSADATPLLVTTGSQQAFELLLKVLIGPGNCVAIERPAYPAAIQALRLSEAKIVDIPSDAQGMDTQALEQTLEAGARPKLLYIVPTFANPTGASLPLERRQHLLALALRYQFLIVEDDPYGALRFSGEPQASLLELAADIPGASEWVIYLSSLSKIMAPGLRIGWMVAPAEILRRCIIAKQTGDLCTAPWMQLTAAQYLRSGRLEQHLPKVVGIYKERCNAMLNALHKHFGQTLEVTAPDGGMFIWARWRDGSEARALLEYAIAENVMYIPGSAFYASAPDPAQLRLSFATASLEEIAEGVARLKRAHDAYRAKEQ